MRFDHATWSSLPGIARAGYWMDCVFDRAERFCAALDGAKVPYAVCGGMSVMAWVSSRNPDFVRTTKDVDVCLRRADLPRAADAVRPIGFELVEVNGVPMFLDGPDGTPKTAVHVVVAGETVSRYERQPVPDFGTPVRDEHSTWNRIGLGELVVMKLLAMRPHDVAHLCDLLRVGLIDATWRQRVPDTLADRFDQVLAEYRRHYADSGH
jgi:hypothetical protein